jgi:ankyrin repeat protein
MLDQEGFEIDSVNTRDGDTALHCAVRYTNDLPEDNKGYGKELIEMMLEAGSDAR